MSGTDADEPATIAVSNQMGGAGKTITSINVAGALADRDHSVLLVDLDPQGAATEGVGLGDVYNRDTTSLHDVLTDTDRFSAVNDLVQERDGFDVVPAHIRMFKTEQRLREQPRTDERLGLVLDTIDAAYDYVILDTPPHLGPLVNNALLAAGNVLIPAQAGRRSVRALELMADQIEMLEDLYDEEITRLGIVVNNVAYPADSDTEEMLAWFDEHFADVGVYEIRKRVALKRAWNNGVSIFEHSEWSDMQQVYEELATAIEGQTASAQAPDQEAEGVGEDGADEEVQA